MPRPDGHPERATPPAIRCPRVLVLDSGIGGLGIASAIRRAVPEAGLTYLADHGWFPYGSRDADALAARLVRLVGLLSGRHAPDLVVIACNTASTAALAALRAAFPALAFVGVVPPVKWAAARSRTRTIGLLATEATVGRAYVRDLRDRFAPDCRLVAHGAGRLAGLAEARFRGEKVTRDAVADELAPLFAAPGGDCIDTICLGCTHYGLLLDELRAAAPAGLEWLDPAEAVARRVAGLLDRPVAPGAASGAAAAPGRAYSTRLPDAAGARDALRSGFARAGFAPLLPLDMDEAALSPPADQWPRLTA